MKRGCGTGKKRKDEIWHPMPSVSCKTLPPGYVLHDITPMMRVSKMILLKSSATNEHWGRNTTDMCAPMRRWTNVIFPSPFLHRLHCFSFDWCSCNYTISLRLCLLQLLSGTDNDELTPPTVRHKTLTPNKNSRALIGDFLEKKIGLKTKTKKKH